MKAGARPEREPVTHALSQCAGPRAMRHAADASLPRFPEQALFPAAMKPDDATTFVHPGQPAAMPDVFHQIGAITRQLHDALHQLGVMPGLRSAALSLPDAKSRLDYIGRKTAEAAGKVLDSVDGAKADQAAIVDETRRIARAIVADPTRTVASGAVMDFVHSVESATARIDRHLTDIMLAQDFHDLTGQVVAKVVALAGDLEDGLVKLLLQTAPAEPWQRAETPGATVPLAGPVVDGVDRLDVVTDQREVDELLASLGF